MTRESCKSLTQRIGGVTHTKSPSPGTRGKLMLLPLLLFSRCCAAIFGGFIRGSSCDPADTLAFYSDLRVENQHLFPERASPDSRCQGPRRGTVRTRSCTRCGRGGTAGARAGQLRAQQRLGDSSPGGEGRSCGLKGVHKAWAAADCKVCPTAVGSLWG